MLERKPLTARQHSSSPNAFAPSRSSAAAAPEDSTLRALCLHTRTGNSAVLPVFIKQAVGKARASATPPKLACALRVEAARAARLFAQFEFADKLLNEAEVALPPFSFDLLSNLKRTRALILLDCEKYADARTIIEQADAAEFERGKDTEPLYSRSNESVSVDTWLLAAEIELAAGRIGDARAALECAARQASSKAATRTDNPDLRFALRLTEAAIELRSGSAPERAAAVLQGLGERLRSGERVSANLKAKLAVLAGEREADAGSATMPAKALPGINLPEAKRWAEFRTSASPVKPESSAETGVATPTNTPANTPADVTAAMNPAATPDASLPSISSTSPSTSSSTSSSPSTPNDTEVVTSVLSMLLDRMENLNARINQPGANPTSVTAATLEVPNDTALEHDDSGFANASDDFVLGGSFLYTDLVTLLCNAETARLTGYLDVRWKPMLVEEMIAEGRLHAAARAGRGRIYLRDGLVFDAECTPSDTAAPPLEVAVDGGNEKEASDRARRHLEAMVQIGVGIGLTPHPGTPPLAGSGARGYRDESVIASRRATLDIDSNGGYLFSLVTSREGELQSAGLLEVTDVEEYGGDVDAAFGFGGEQELIEEAIKEIKEKAIDTPRPAPPALSTPLVLPNADDDVLFVEEPLIALNESRRESLPLAAQLEVEDELDNVLDLDFTTATDEPAGAARVATGTPTSTARITITGIANEAYHRVATAAGRGELIEALRRAAVFDDTGIASAARLCAGENRKILAEAHSQPWGAAEQLRSRECVRVFEIEPGLWFELATSAPPPPTTYAEESLRTVFEIAGLRLRCLPAPPVSKRCVNRHASAGIHFESSKMRAVYDRVEQLASGTTPVLITGETGTGKELVARRLHALSPRAAAPLVVENMASVPANLIESLLLGHVRGSFTGADGERDGLIKQAEGGTLFLDEYGELGFSEQGTVLRVIEDKRFRPLGWKRRESLACDVRFVLATNRNIDDANLFRSDIKYRCQVIRLPALREHPEDIPVLARHFAQERDAAISEAAIAWAEGQAWDGNIRQLRACIEEAALGCRREQQSPSAIEVAGLAEAYRSYGSGSSRAGESTRQDTSGDASGALLGSGGGDGPRFVPAANETLSEALARFERVALETALATAGTGRGQLQRAADIYGEKRQNFSNLLKKHGIKT